LLLSGHPEQAWLQVNPRLATASFDSAWLVSLALQREQRTTPAQAARWLASDRLDGAQIGQKPVQAPYIAALTLVDRMPSKDDIDLLASLDDRRGKGYAEFAGLLRAVLQGSTAQIARPPLTGALYPDVLPVEAFFALNTWHATGARSPAIIQALDMPDMESFNGTLWRAVAFAALGHRNDALQALSSARIVIGRWGPMGLPPFDNRPYYLVLTHALLARETRDDAYRVAGARLARIYQLTQPWSAWPYAAEALLATDDKIRAADACRAQRLDPTSMFLGLSELKPDPKGAACRKAGWQVSAL